MLFTARLNKGGELTWLSMHALSKGGKLTWLSVHVRTKGGKLTLDNLTFNARS